MTRVGPDGGCDAGTEGGSAPGRGCCSIRSIQRATKSEERGTSLAGKRKAIPVATEAALWTLSNGRCYAPACPFPVIAEVRPGVYRKNALVAHIYSVRPNAPRFDKKMSDEERDSFVNLLLLCLPHHTEVDDKKTGEERYPPDLLHKWKIDHEGSNGPALAELGSIREERLTELLVDVFSPPVERLQAIAERLEETGTLNAGTVAELRQIVDVLTNTPAGPDGRTAASLGFAAEVFGDRNFRKAATSLAAAADALPSSNEIARLREAAEIISAASRNIRRYGREM